MTTSAAKLPRRHPLSPAFFIPPCALSQFLMAVYFRDAGTITIHPIPSDFSTHNTLSSNFYDKKFGCDAKRHYFC